jgi:protein O-GlcNAc transferase
MTAAHTFNNDRSPDRRLRIGYISPDLHKHDFIHFLEPILANHDHRKFEIFCYSNQPETDAATARLRSHADHWRKIYSFSDAEVTDLILKDEIDIVIDLALRAHAQKFAPLQGSYLAYTSTADPPELDFRLTDVWIDPPGADKAHTEKLVRLPDTCCVYRPPKNIPDISPLPADTNGHITFGVATNQAKINTTTLAMWCQALHTVPDSRLIIKGTQPPNTSTLQSFLDAGVSEERIVLESSASFLEYFQFFSRIDLVLDTFPAAAAPISCHALYMGVPIITRTGDASLSRVTASLLHNVELPSLIADSAESFVRIAVDTSKDLPRLRQIRSTLRPTMQKSPLMNETHFVRNVETAYRNLWKDWCANPQKESALRT